MQSLLLRGTIHATPSPAFDRARALALAEQANTLARALGEIESAIELLHQARGVAEAMQARRMLWQIFAALSEIENTRGNPREAEKFLAQARAIISFIADHTPEDLRESFLNLPNVKTINVKFQGGK